MKYLRYVFTKVLNLYFRVRNSFTIWKGTRKSYLNLTFMNKLVWKERKLDDTIMRKKVINPFKFSNHPYCVSYNGDYWISSSNLSWWLAHLIILIKSKQQHHNNNNAYNTMKLTAEIRQRTCEWITQARESSV